MEKTEIGKIAHRWPDDDAMKFLEKKAREWAREPPTEQRCERCGGANLVRTLHVSIESRVSGCGEAVVSSARHSSDAKTVGFGATAWLPWGLYRDDKRPLQWPADLHRQQTTAAELQEAF